MTTGAITRGDSSGIGGYFRRSWSGVDSPSPRPKPLPWNNYTCLVYMRNNVPGTGNIVWSPSYSDAPNGEVLPLFSDSDWVNHLNQLGPAVRGHSFNLGVAMAEAPDAVKMIAHNAQRICSSIRWLRKGSPGEALRALGARSDKLPRGIKSHYAPNRLTTRDVSSMWLELQYGWKPLVTDVHEAAKAVESHTKSARRTRIVINAGRMTKEFTSLYNSALASAGTVAHKHVRSRRLIYELSEVLPVARSLGLQNPASVLWEAVPFSFIADWFIPIGAYLDNLGTIPFLTGRLLVIDRYTIKSNGIGNLDTGRRGYYFPPDYPSSPAVMYKDNSFAGASYSFTGLNLSRTFYSNGQILVTQRPMFLAPSWGLNAGRLKNAIALLHVLTK